MRAAVSSCRRSIDFNVAADDTQSASPVLVSNQELFFCSLHYLSIVLHELLCAYKLFTLYRIFCAINE